MVGKTVWETEDQYDHAAQQERFSGLSKESIALAGDYCRICRPSLEENKKKKIAFIIWKRDASNDNKPSWDKVVSRL